MGVYKVCCAGGVQGVIASVWRVTSGPRMSPSQPQLAPSPVLITTARRRDTRGWAMLPGRAEPHAARGASWQGAPVITWTSENKPMNITQIMHSEYSARASRTARPMNLNLNQSRRETPRCVGAGAGAAALLLYVNVCEWFTVTTLKGAHCTHDRRAPRTPLARFWCPVLPPAAQCGPVVINEARCEDATSSPADNVTMPGTAARWTPRLPRGSHCTPPPPPPSPSPTPGSGLAGDYDGKNAISTL